MQPPERLERIYWWAIKGNLVLTAGAFFFVPEAAPAYLLGVVGFGAGLWATQRARKLEERDGG